LVYRKNRELDPKVILNNLQGWKLFPYSTEGSEGSASYMGGEDTKVEGFIGWEGNHIHFVVVGNSKAWGEIPAGVTGLSLTFTVYPSDDIDSNLYYTTLVDEAQLEDVVMSNDGEIIGNIYSQKISEDDDDDIHHSLALITDNGMIGRGYFAYSKDAPVANRIISVYTRLIESIGRELSNLPEFHAAVSGFETGQSNRSSLEVILRNDAEENEKKTWYNPVAGLDGWQVFLPYTEDAFAMNIYQKVSGHPVEMMELALYPANDNQIPWHEKSTNLLVRPDLDDIRFSTTYSIISINIERKASRVLPVYVFDEEEAKSTITVDGLEVELFNTVEEQETFYNGESSKIFAHRLTAIQKDIDVMLAFDYISTNQTDAYTKDIEKIVANLVTELKEVVR
jgi:hypothetical protein